MSKAPVKISWDNVPEVDYYNLYIRPSGGRFYRYNESPIYGLEKIIEVTTANPDLDYTCYVTSVKDNVESYASDIISFTVPLVPPFLDSHINLNGTSQYLNTGFTFGENGQYMNQFTFEIWFKSNETGIRTLFGASDSAGDSIFALKINQNRFGNHQHGRITIQIRDQDGLQRFMVSSTRFWDLNDGSWHHLAYQKVADTQEYKLYFNGEETGLDIGGSGRNQDPSSFTELSTPAFLGAKNSGSSDINNLSGSMQDVRMWSDIRTEQQIQDNMFDRLESSSWEQDYPNLLFYYMLNEGSGDIAYDQTGNYNATLINNVSDNMWDNSFNI